MYQIVTLEDEISVPPAKLGKELNVGIKESIVDKYEGKIDNDIGVVLAITEINNIGEGTLRPGDPSVHYPVRFQMLTWMPKDQELVEGEVVDIMEWGAFIRIGPVDGLIHISQVMDDFVSFDEKGAQLIGRASRRILKVGDRVRARIITISLKEQSKVGLTMRQPFLGNPKWAEEKVEKKEKAEAPKKSKAKPK